MKNTPLRKEFLRRKKAEKERAQRNLDSLSRLGEVVGQMLADDLRKQNKKR